MRGIVDEERTVPTLTTSWTTLRLNGVSIVVYECRLQY